MYKLYKYFFTDYKKKEYVIISYNGHNKDIVIHSKVLNYIDAISYLSYIQNKQKQFITYNGLGNKQFHIVKFSNPITS